MMLRIIIGVIIITLVGCSTTGTTQNRKLAKLAVPLIKSFLHQDGCNMITSKKNIGALPDGDYFGKRLSKEHWQVEGCGKTYDFELSISSDSKHTAIKKL